MRHSVAQKRERRHPHGMQSGTEAEYGGYPGKWHKQFLL